MAAFARELQLTEAQVAQAHRRYVNELIDEALADEELTDDEYEMLVRVAAALDFDQSQIEARVASFRTQESLTVLSAGMQVVFTGNHPKYAHEELQAYAASLGLEPAGGVAKSTALVCAADAVTTSGKAAKARRYGIPVVTVDEFVRARIGDILAGTGRRTGGPQGGDMPRLPDDVDSPRNLECEHDTGDATRVRMSRPSPRRPRRRRSRAVR